MAKAYVQRDTAVTGKYYVETEGGGDTPAGGIDYSTTEQDTGLKWIDNKPIYQITYNISSISGSNNDLVDITNLGTDTIIKIDGVLKGSDIDYPGLIYDSSSSHFILFISKSGTNKHIRGRAKLGSGTISNAFVTIQYTKTE